MASKKFRNGNCYTEELLKGFQSLAKQTKSTIIEERWKIFGIQPAALIKQRDEQIERLLNYKQQGEGEIFQSQIYQKVQVLQWRRHAQSADANRIPQKDDKLIQKFGFSSIFSHKTRYLPMCWISREIQKQLEKYNLCNVQWSIGYVEKYDHLLYKNYLTIEGYINEFALYQSLCYKDYSHRQDNNYASTLKQLNERFNQDCWRNELWSS